MQWGKPSRTALSVATHRAVHQSAEEGRIFRDPLAARIVGDEWVERDAEATRGIRLWVAMRARIAEDALEKAVARGVEQMVVLGAGLDTFAYRNPYPELRVFEVDHPATQAWKRERLGRAGIAIPETLRFAPVDFERETIGDGLAAVGFDAARAAFFTWMGVVMYLEKSAVWSTLEWIGATCGNEVVFDYSDPPETLRPEDREYARRLAERAGAAGEPMVSYFEAGELAEKVRQFGFSEVEDIGPRELFPRFFPGVPPRPGNRGGHVLRAANMPK